MFAGGTDVEAETPNTLATDPPEVKDNDLLL